MGYMIAIGGCVNCGCVFGFNPDTVPSIRVSRIDGGWKLDSNGQREPVCESCINRANQKRIADGLEPFHIAPDAYAPQEHP